MFYLLIFILETFTLSLRPPSQLGCLSIQFVIQLFCALWGSTPHADFFVAVCVPRYFSSGLCPLTRRTLLQPAHHHYSRSPCCLQNPNSRPWHFRHPKSWPQSAFPTVSHNTPSCQTEPLHTGTMISLFHSLAHPFSSWDVFIHSLPEFRFYHPFKIQGNVSSAPKPLDSPILWGFVSLQL